MASVATAPTVEATLRRRQCRTCYDLLDSRTSLCGVSDLTDGKYVDGQTRQHDRAAYLAGTGAAGRISSGSSPIVGAGTRLLDIGCGYGRILGARRGGAERKSIGITVSPPQVASCRARGLAVCELNYRNIFSSRG